MLRKKNLIFLPVLALSLVWRGASAATVKIEVGDRTARPGESVELPIKVSKLGGLGIISADLRLAYDAAALSFSQLSSSGTVLEGKVSPVYKNIPGLLNIALYSAETFKGQGALLNIFFHVSARAKPGKTKILLNKALFNEGKIGAVLKNGMVEIRPQ